MDKQTILSALRNQKTKDYSLVIIFFLVFSFFIFFAIRPNILTIFSLQKEREELKKVDANYEDVIMSIVQTQTLLEQYRDKLGYLDDSLPLAPQVNKVVDDIRQSASQSGTILSQMQVSTLSLKEDADIDKLQFFELSMSTPSDFGDIKSFVDILIAQRRLKVLKRIIMNKSNPESTQSGQLGTQLQIDNYYL